MKNLRRISLSILFVVFATLCQAQLFTGVSDINTINTAVPFLRINPDPASSGMGDLGIASKPGVNAIYWNPAKLVFAEKQTGSTLNATHWLSALVNGINLFQVANYYKINDRHAVGASFRYFDLGTLYFFSPIGSTGSADPYEFVADLSYSFKLSKELGLGLNLKYIHSDLATGQNINGVEIEVGTSVAADVGVYYAKPHKRGNADAVFAAGLAVANAGSKLYYTEQTYGGDFLPANLGLGLNYELEFSDTHTFTTAMEFNKLLVPTPTPVDADMNGYFDYKEQSVLSGMLSSFSDAPNGFKEEINEVTMAFGLEYLYKKRFAARVGGFSEHETKGDRNYLTAGAGATFDWATVDISFLFADKMSPLRNTYRLGLGMAFG